MKGTSKQLIMVLWLAFWLYMYLRIVVIYQHRFFEFWEWMGKRVYIPELITNGCLSLILRTSQHWSWHACPSLIFVAYNPTHTLVDIHGQLFPKFGAYLSSAVQELVCTQGFGWTIACNWVWACKNCPRNKDLQEGQ